MDTKQLMIKAVIETVIEKHLPTHYLAEKVNDVVPVVKVDSKYFYILGAGHGSIDPITGELQTRGKRHTFSDGFKVIEGVLNRKVLAKTIELAKDLPLNIRFGTTSHEWKDTPLRERTNKANEYCDLYGVDNCQLLDIHHNAHNTKRANGIEVFYWGKDGYFSGEGAKSALIYNNCQSEEMAQFRNRGVKFANHHMTREVKCTGILAEGAFMTNREDAEEMTSDYGILCYAKANIAWITKMEA